MKKLPLGFPVRKKTPKVMTEDYVTSKWRFLSESLSDIDLSSDTSISWFVERYSLPVVFDDLIVREKKSDEFMTCLRKESTCEYDFFSHLKYSFFELENVVVRTIKRNFDGLSITVLAPDVKHVHDFVKRFKNFLKKPSSNQEAEISYFVYTGDHVETRSIWINQDKLSGVLPELYPDLHIDLLVDEYIKACDSLLVLHGPPGVGKTSFLKFLVHHLTKNVNHNHHNKPIAYVKDQRAIKEDSFWTKLIEETYSLVIFDDLDYALLPRSKDKDNSFVSQLLSFSCGLFGNDTKVVISTNREYDDIDDALLRPGRCFDVLFLNKLTRNEAFALWTERFEQTSSSFDEFFPANKKQQISQAELMKALTYAKHQQQLREYVKRGHKTYTVKEKLQNVKKRIGFRND